MLILTRRVGETIIIEPTTGEKSEVTVLGVKGSHVRVGTQAPTSSLLYANPLNPDSSSHLHHGIVTGEGAMDLVGQCALLTGYGSGNAAAMNQLPA